MNDAAIREYRTADVPGLIRLWTAVFDDTESAAESFFTALPDIGAGTAAFVDGEIAGAAYLIDGQELADGDKRLRIGYIYGVGVYEKYRRRGIGERLVKAVYELSKRRGADIVTCLPAEKSLYAWYERLVDFRYTLKCEKLTVKTEAAGKAVRISAAEYAHRREEAIGRRSHVILSAPALEFEKRLFEEYGGGFFMTQSGVCAAYIDGGKALVREVISADRVAAMRTAEAVGAALGAAECEIRFPSADGDEYVCSDRPLPDGCIWNLTFD